MFVEQNNEVEDDLKLYFHGEFLDLTKTFQELGLDEVTTLIYEWKKYFIIKIKNNVIFY